MKIVNYILMQEQIPKVEDRPINLPDPTYTPPMIFTTKRAKDKIATHLTFLGQLTEK